MRGVNSTPQQKAHIIEYEIVQDPKELCMKFVTEEQEVEKFIDLGIFVRISLNSN